MNKTEYFLTTSRIMPRKTISSAYIEKNFPELLNYKRLSSRRYDGRDHPTYRDDWWINFTVSDLDENEFIVFAGARDKGRTDFQLFKVPTRYLRKNLDKLSVTDNG